MRTTGGETAAGGGDVDGCGRRYPKLHITVDPDGLARLDRLACAFGRTRSEVIRLALEYQEAGNNRLARHGIREPLQAIRLAWCELAPRLTRPGDDELRAIVDRSLREISGRLETRDAPQA